MTFSPDMATATRPSLPRPCPDGRAGFARAAPDKTEPVVVRVAHGPADWIVVAVEGSYSRETSPSTRPASVTTRSGWAGSWPSSVTATPWAPLARCHAVAADECCRQVKPRRRRARQTGQRRRSGTGRGTARGDPGRPDTGCRPGARVPQTRSGTHPVWQPPSRPRQPARTSGRRRRRPPPRRTIASMPAKTRSALGKQGAAVARRKRTGGDAPKTRAELYEIAKRRDLRPLQDGPRRAGSPSRRTLSVGEH
jgi:hypothetical protein